MIGISTVEGLAPINPPLLLCNRIMKTMMKLLNDAVASYISKKEVSISMTLLGDLLARGSGRVPLSRVNLSTREDSPRTW